MWGVIESWMDGDILAGDVGLSSPGFVMKIKGREFVGNTGIYHL